jgi:hypothetical protein
MTLNSVELALYNAIGSIATSLNGLQEQLLTLLTPAVTAVSPNSGVEAVTVQISGSGFTGTTAVNFGTVAATNFTVNSDTGITAVVPMGSGTVDVTVTNSFGTSPVNASDEFLYAVLPVVTSLSIVLEDEGGGASNGEGSPGDPATITGTGFTGVTSVKFIGAEVTSFTVDSDTEISTIVPNGQSGSSGNVIVTNAAGSSVAGDGNFFEYED